MTPQIGLFVSPDTIVPDPGLVSDYNRSMYTRGNPLVYNDPTGHCASGDPPPTGTDENTEYLGCWGTVDNILRLWDKDKSGYFDKRFGSRDAFMKNYANITEFGYSFMQNETIAYYSYQSSPEGKEKARNIVRSETYERKSRADDYKQKAYCQDRALDCITLASDGGSITGGVIVIASPLCGPGIAVCASVGVAVGTASSAVGLTSTTVGYLSGQSSVQDLAVTLTSNAVGVSPAGDFTKLAATIVQLMYDKLIAPND